MASRSTLILHSGGLRSLVATARVVGLGDAASVLLLHVRDGRDTSTARIEHLRRQARHFDIQRVHVVDLPQLPAQRSRRGVTEPSPAGPASLVRAQVLLTALAQSIDLNAVRLVWPVQHNGGFEFAARVTEQLVLLRQLAQIDLEEAAQRGVERPAAALSTDGSLPAPIPEIDTPLLDLTDQQVIELGGQMDVPWYLAWSCLLPQERPCRLCTACRRRRQAFDAAGMIDPVEMPGGVELGTPATADDPPTSAG